jgi:hypothetical protein
MNAPLPTPADKPKLDALDILVLHHLQNRLGKHMGIGVVELSRLTNIPDRKLRDCVTHLRLAGFAVLSTPETGYYIAKTASEVRECCAFLERRAMGTLVLIARLRNLTMPELLGQMQLDLHVPTT